MAAKKDANEPNDAASSDKPKTCFVIMPISDVEGYRPGHFREVYEELIKPAVKDAGYECDRADESSSSHLIHMEVVSKVVNADLCICDLSTRNPNVLFECGMRQAFDKPTVLIKDDKTSRIFDLSGFRDLEYDHTLRVRNVLDTRSRITNAIYATVAEATDNNQVLSLIKMMKIASATLPQGEVDQAAAELNIVNYKLDRLSEIISERSAGVGAKRQANEVSPINGLPYNVGDSYSIGTNQGFYQLQFVSNGVRVTGPEGVKFRVASMRAFERGTHTPSLPVEVQSIIKSYLVKLGHDDLSAESPSVDGN